VYYKSILSSSFPKKAMRQSFTFVRLKKANKYKRSNNNGLLTAT